MLTNLGPGPPLLWKKTAVPSAAVLQLHSTLFTVVPGRVGSVIVPEYWFMRKEAGTVYAANPSDRLVLVIGSIGSPIQMMAGVLSSAFLGVPTPTHLIDERASVVFMESGADILGSPLSLYSDTANVTDGNADLEILIGYRMWEARKLVWN